MKSHMRVLAILGVLTVLLPVIPVSAAPAPKVLVLHSSIELYELASRLENELAASALAQPGTVPQNKILESQGLTPALLLNPMNAIVAGNTAQADAVVVLTLAAADEAALSPRRSHLISVSVYDTNSGVRVLIGYVEWNRSETGDAVGRILGLLVPVWRQIPLSRRALIPITLAPAHRVQLGSEYQWLCDALQNLCAARMRTLPGVVFLTQDDVERATSLKQQRIAGDPGVIGGLSVVSFYLQPSAGRTLELRVRTRREVQPDVWGGRVLFEPSQWAQAFARILTETQKDLMKTGVPSPDLRDTQPMAKRYAEQGALLCRFGLFRESIPLLATAWVLDPENVVLTQAVLAAEMNCLFAGNSPWGDIQRAQWVSLFVRQAERIGDGGNIRDLVVLLQPGQNDESYFLDWYLTSYWSVTPDAVRSWNRESRKRWGELVRKAWEFQYGDDYDKGASRLRAAVLAMSDDPAVAMVRLRALIRQSCLPPAEGGLFSAPERRYYFCLQWLLVDPFRQMFHLYDEERSVQRYWVAFLEELASDPDPTVRITACIALGILPSTVFRRPSDGRYEHWLPQQIRIDADGYCRRALSGFARELPTPNEPYSDTIKRELRKQMLLCMKSAWLANHKDWLLDGIEGIVRPLVAQRDVKNLALWEPWKRVQAKDFSISADSPDREYARRYERLMREVLALMEGTDVPAGGGGVASGAKTALAELKLRFASADRLAAANPCNMEVLVSQRDWMPAWNPAWSCVASRSLLGGNRLWVAFLRRATGKDEAATRCTVHVAVAGIEFGGDPERVLMLGQFQAEMADPDVTSSVPLSLAATARSVFVASPSLGTVQFAIPESQDSRSAVGQMVLQPPNEKGQPLRTVGMACDGGGRLWLALEDSVSTAIGRYDVNAPCLRDVFRLNDILPLGSSARLVDLAALADRFYLVLRVSDSAGARWEVWRWNPDKRDGKLLVVFPERAGSDWRLESGPTTMFLKSSATMVEFSAAGDAALMQLGDKNLLSSLALERIHGFTLGASFAQAHPWGKGRPGAFDLSSAALADRERIWGLLNDGRILSAANGAEAADVQLYSGNSLEGQPAIYFGLCPTGVVAIGDGIVAAPRPAPAIPEE